jgi:hypothetical protein
MGIEGALPGSDTPLPIWIGQMGNPISPNRCRSMRGALQIGDRSSGPRTIHQASFNDSIPIAFVEPVGIALLFPARSNPY